MTYNPNVPEATEKLSVSQGNLKTNSTAANTSFGIDHYPFDDLTANNGHHKTIHQPDQSSLPAIGSTAQITGYEKNSNLGTLSWGQSTIPGTGSSSIIPFNSSSSPISLAAGATTDIIDVTGLTIFYAQVFAVDIKNFLSGNLQFANYIISYDGATLNLRNLSVVTPVSILSVIETGAKFQLKNAPSATITLSNVFWTMNIYRAV